MNERVRNNARTLARIENKVDEAMIRLKFPRDFRPPGRGSRRLGTGDGYNDSFGSGSDGDYDYEPGFRVDRRIGNGYD